MTPVELKQPLPWRMRVSPSLPHLRHTARYRLWGRALLVCRSTNAERAQRGIYETFSLSLPAFLPRRRV